MKRVMVDAETLAKLAGLNSPMEFSDDAGRTLGRFVPARLETPISTEFWKVEHLDLNDALNEVIWKESPEVQDSIQAYGKDYQIGAQQAMFARRLPWVPDIVGKSWRSDNALMIVGSAYGPFISSSPSKYQLSPDEYAKPSAAAFQEVYVKRIVEVHQYYTKVKRIAELAVRDASSLALFDLCRVIFCTRDNDEKTRGGDGVVNKDHRLFHSYVEGDKPREWLWRRFEESKASAVIALGTIAEHGLLRLFSACLSDPRIIDSCDSSVEFKIARESVKWPSKHAHPARKLKLRNNDTVPHWNVSGVTRTGERRAWRIAVVPHPTGARGDFSDYTCRAVTQLADISRISR